MRCSRSRLDQRAKSGLSRLRAQKTLKLAVLGHHFPQLLLNSEERKLSESFKVYLRTSKRPCRDFIRHQVVINESAAREAVMFTCMRSHSSFHFPPLQPLCISTVICKTNGYGPRSTVTVHGSRLLSTAHGYFSQLAVTVHGPRLLFTAYCYCPRSTVTAHGPRLLFTAHSYCPRSTVTAHGPQLLFTAHGYCPRSKVTALGPRLLFTAHGTVHASRQRARAVTLSRDGIYVTDEYRLINGSTCSEGNIQLRSQNQTWGLVCGKAWPRYFRAANTFCQSLGFRYVLIFLHSY